MLDNFGGAEDGNFVGAQVVKNTVTCNGRCHYGIMLGPHCWCGLFVFWFEYCIVLSFRFRLTVNIFFCRYNSAAIIGGTVSNNYVSGGGFNINVDIATGISVFGNTFGALGRSIF